MVSFIISTSRPIVLGFSNKGERDRGMRTYGRKEKCIQSFVENLRKRYRVEDLVCRIILKYILKKLNGKAWLKIWTSVRLL
jgi:hypothetical protein